MREQYEIIPVSLAELPVKTLLYKQKGARLGQICAVSNGNSYELSYTFIMGYTAEHLRLFITQDDIVPSISDSFPSASLYENEMKELFGVKISGIALDFDNKFYRIQEETPFKEGGHHE